MCLIHDYSFIISNYVLNNDSKFIFFSKLAKYVGIYL